MKRLLYIVPIVCLWLSACTPNPPEPTPQPDVFDYGSITSYGAYYAETGLPNNVYMLDVYTHELRLNREGFIEGSGRNLCLSDIFTPPTDSTLQAGVTYVTDTTGEAGTFLPGQNFDGNINGAYLLDITDGKVTNITLFQSGTFALHYDGDTTCIDFELLTTSKKAYKASCRAILPYKKKK